MRQSYSMEHLEHCPWAEKVLGMKLIRNHGDEQRGNAGWHIPAVPMRDGVGNSDAKGAEVDRISKSRDF